MGALEGRVAIITGAGRGAWSLDGLAKEAAKWGEITFDQGLSFG